VLLNVLPQPQNPFEVDMAQVEDLPLVERMCMSARSCSPAHSLQAPPRCLFHDGACQQPSPGHRGAAATAQGALVSFLRDLLLQETAYRQLGAPHVQVPVAAPLVLRQRPLTRPGPGCRQSWPTWCACSECIFKLQARSTFLAAERRAGSPFSRIAPAGRSLPAAS